LTRPDDLTDRWHGPYIMHPAKDPWGNPYIYRLLPSGNFEIRCTYGKPDTPTPPSTTAPSPTNEQGRR